MKMTTCLKCKEKIYNDPSNEKKMHDECKRKQRIEEEKKKMAEDRAKRGIRESSGFALSRNKDLF